VQALILVAPALGDRRPDAADQIEAIGQRIGEVGLEAAVEELRHGLLEQGAAPEEAEEAVAPWRGQCGPALREAIASVVSWTIFDDWARLEALRLPVAIVGIPDDPWHPLAFAHRLAAALPCSALAALGSRAAASVPGALGRASVHALGALGLA
jgi:pimeloyl-ACP methyl ester carboxylesterase